METPFTSVPVRLGAAAASRRPPAKTTAPPSARQARRSALAGLRVLVIEDDAASSKLVAIIMTDAGAQVTAVATAEEGLVVLESWKPRIIVLDLVLPRMGGLRFVEEVRRDPQYGDVTIVAVTSMNGPQAERAALEAGCDAYVKKPIATGELVRTIAQVLRGKT